MELNETIPFIIKTQWPVKLGANPAGYWWSFGILYGTVSLLPAVKLTPQSLSVLEMDWKVPTFTALV
jgi:hypothetical protein